MLSDGDMLVVTQTTIIGLLLTSDRFSEAIGLRWRLLPHRSWTSTADWERLPRFLRDSEYQGCPSALIRKY
jgi:hypothetical protein